MQIINLLIILLNLPLRFGSSTSRNAECSYRIDSYTFLKFAYICEVKNNLDIISPQSASIDSISGSHSSGKSNDDVISFAAYGKNVQYFPKGLKKIFKSLQIIRIEFGLFKEIRQEDLKPFPKLVELNIRNNEIQILVQGLFAYNPDLELIWLSYNKIVHIGENVFESLTKLTHLSLFFNDCISIGSSNRTAVMEIVKQAKTKCVSPEFATLEKNLKELEAECAFIMPGNLTSFKEKVKNFEKQFNSSKFVTTSDIKERISNLSEKSFKGTEINKMEAVISESILRSLDESTEARLNKMEQNMSDKFTKLQDLLNIMTGHTSNNTEIIEKDLKSRINALDEAMKKTDEQINKALDAKVSIISNEIKTLTDKIDNIERIIRDYISSDAHTMSNFQSNVDERLKVQNYNIEKSSGIQDYTQSVLVASCAFLVWLIIYIAYKKFLLRMILVQQEMDGIY